MKIMASDVALQSNTLKKTGYSYTQTTKQFQKKLNDVASTNKRGRTSSSKREMISDTLKRLIEIIERAQKGKLKFLYSGDNSSEQTATDSSGVWYRKTETSFSYYEKEAVAFSGTGTALTQDGRSISFNVNFSMSREFAGQINQQFEKAEGILCDPLVINVSRDVTSLSDMTFSFDLDSDGKEDDIHLLNNGCGFLALDKNNNDKIDNGNELFGTMSGNGFADLAKYDLDHNGFIDENDDIYSSLKVWIKTEDSDELINLKDADVGAIYLGNVSSTYSLNSIKDNMMYGQISRTGLFLHESTGQAGTVMHVDFAI